MGIPQARLTTTQKGLGWAHQKVRAALLRDLIEGTPCDWCGEPMYSVPTMNPDHKPLEADHSLARSHGGTRADRLLHHHCNRVRGDGTRPGGLKRWNLLGDTPTPTRLDPIPRLRDCAYCGVTFKAQNRDQRTCSRTCGVELRRQENPPPPPPPKAPTTRECSECGTPFETTHPTQVCCSRECGYQRNKRQIIERYHNDPDHRASVIERAKARYRNAPSDLGIA